MATVTLTTENRLKELRTTQSLTQKQLAVKSGVSLPSIVKIERSGITPANVRESTLTRLAVGLGYEESETGIVFPNVN